MILTELDGATTFYRALTPRWAHRPLSGAGAASKGGRLNRPGVHALYLSESAELAAAEYQQGRFPMPPYTMASYFVRLHAVVDFRGGYEAEHWSSLWNQLDCNWRKFAFLEKTEPPSWRISDEILSARHVGVLFDSNVATGANLVIFTESLDAEDALRVHDPGNDLPSNAASWK